MTDSRFCDNDGWFKCYAEICENVVYAVAAIGYGRPQFKDDVLRGKDGKMLTIIQNIKTGDVSKENPDNWTDKNNKRFIQIYSPIFPTNDSYRFDMWLTEKKGAEKLTIYRSVQNKLNII